VIRPYCLAAAALACAAPLHAQTAAPPPVEFFPRAVFQMSGEQFLGVEDRRFRYDARFGGELDLVDYGAGRLTFVADYEAIMGDELRKFDLNQGNYILEGAVSARVEQFELAGVIYHQSRHLSDRPKPFPVDWNMLGVRVRRGFLLGATHMDVRGDFRGTYLRSYVDYTWEAEGRVRADYVIRPGIGVMAAGAVRHLGVDGSRDRGGQSGFRAEGGIRFDGRAGGIELFAATERRIDPYQLEFGTATWATVGFRLLSP
jgi:hypothetical protein